MAIPQNEFVTTVHKAGYEIQVGLDDYGQQYYFQYTDENGNEHEVGCGAFNTDYEGFIEYYFTPVSSYYCCECGHCWSTSGNPIKCVRCDSEHIIGFDDKRRSREAMAAEYRRKHNG